ncbi:bifunctional DNA-binding transcriptional regulator/O6-methylguanine-DNA methyltransferase Ada [Sandaracinus amylolyticus]|nr:bifunctional DNA-binding transcriptional regulator/O6-methylguanine-DNA methyltransferase Ada [Sandaracinus amylolyticus]
MDAVVMGTEDDARWAAVVARDRAADGTFVYAVRTTGVYCRPSCASRLARRENVEFHRGASEAERAGFRACRRCRPGEASPAERQAARIAEICRVLDDADREHDLDALAASAGMSRFHFQRVFKSITGVTPKAYARARRAERVRSELARGASVTSAMYAAGFRSSGRFYEHSDAMLGMVPSAFREGARSLTIRFAIGACSLGAILVAATDVGVCSILLGDDPDALAAELQERFPHATFEAGEREFDAWVARVVGLVEAPRVGLDLPLDVRGTAFQQRVWAALRAIPVGTTASYADVARAIGMPDAARAVAGACAANPLAVAIPCHRVVRRDGELSGYRWGVERKRELLRRES